MKLTRDQRARLFAGECPGITGVGTCPLKPGDVHLLSSRLAIKVLHVRRRKNGGWVLDYEVQDRRDPVRLLRRTPHAQDFDAIRQSYDEHGAPKPLTEETREDAAQDSAYTSAPSTLSDAGEAVNQTTQDVFSKQVRTKAGQQATLNQLRREQYELDQRLQRAREEARLRGVDISSPIRVIERQLAKIERQVYEGKAA